MSEALHTVVPSVLPSSLPATLGVRVSLELTSGFLNSTLLAFESEYFFVEKGWEDRVDCL